VTDYFDGQGGPTIIRPGPARDHGPKTTTGKPPSRRLHAKNPAFPVETGRHPKSGEGGILPSS